MRYFPVTTNTSYPVAVNKHPRIKLEMKVEEWSDSSSPLYGAGFTTVFLYTLWCWRDKSERPGPEPNLSHAVTVDGIKKKTQRTTPTIFIVAMTLTAVLQIYVSVVTSKNELSVLCDIKRNTALCTVQTYTFWRGSSLFLSVKTTFFVIYICSPTRYTMWS